MGVDDGDGLVILFPKGQFEKGMNERESALDELPVRRRREGRACRHHEEHGVFVSTSSRLVTCRGCEVVLDPIEVLDWIAGLRENLVNRGLSLRREADYLQEKVTELERVERNARARIKAARKRRADGDALRVAARALAERAERRNWDEMGEGQQDAAVKRIEMVIEEYVGALLDGK